MAVKEVRVPALREDLSPRHHEPPKAVTIETPSPHAALGPGATLVTSLAAGAAAGALAKTAIAPLDRTKINFQISQTPYSWRAALQFLVATVRYEGVVALWRGNSATMARIVPYAAVQFTAHEQWKRALGVDTAREAQAHPVRLLIAGSLAGVTSQSATYPLDVARARMAITPIVKGYVVTVMGVVPYAGVSFFTYDTLKRRYHEMWGRAPVGPVLMALGGAAGALGQTASYPLDIVRRRLQVAHTKVGAAHTVHQIYKTEGWRGFFKGLSMNWVKGPIAVGISFASYDTFKHTLRDLALLYQ